MDESQDDISVRGESGFSETESEFGQNQGNSQVKSSSKTKGWLIGLGIFAVIVAIILMVVFLYVLPKRRQELKEEAEKQKLIDKPKADAQIVKNQAFLASKPPSKLVEWTDYYTKFTYFSKDLISPGCEPVFYYNPQNKKSIVLCHGLSDSPYYVRAIADVFTRIGYNVYCPLLHMHGLKNPDNMTGVSLEEWKLNFGFAIETAQKKTPASVSIGGFSTGGALAMYFACKFPDVITGDIFLFSAALKIPPFGWKGKTKEVLVRSFLADWVDDIENKSEPIVMIPDAYRYNYVDFSGKKQLATLIGELDSLVPTIQKSKHIFAVHSDMDTTASKEGVIALQQYVTTFEFILIPKELNIAHSEVVVEMPIVYNDKIKYEANPMFDKIMEAMKTFANGSTTANSNKATNSSTTANSTEATNNSLPNGSMAVPTAASTGNGTAPNSSNGSMAIPPTANGTTAPNSSNGPVISNSMLTSNAFVDINQNSSPSLTQ